jgi:hypothetical protein
MLPSYLGKLWSELVQTYNSIIKQETEAFLEDLNSKLPKFNQTLNLFKSHLNQITVSPELPQNILGKFDILDARMQNMSSRFIRQLDIENSESLSKEQVQEKFNEIYQKCRSFLVKFDITWSPNIRFFKNSYNSESKNKRVAIEDLRDGLAQTLLNMGPDKDFAQAKEIYCSYLLKLDFPFTYDSILDEVRTLQDFKEFDLFLRLYIPFRKNYFNNFTKVYFDELVPRLDLANISQLAETIINFDKFAVKELNFQSLIFAIFYWKDDDSSVIGGYFRDLLKPTPFNETYQAAHDGVVKFKNSLKNLNFDHKSQVIEILEKLQNQIFLKYGMIVF